MRTFSVPTSTKAKGRPRFARRHATQSFRSIPDGVGTGSGCVCQVPRYIARPSEQVNIPHTVC